MNKDLFEQAAAERLRKEAPLARRVAPRTLDDLVGQEHILAPGKILRRAIEADRVTSLILYGPPGCGKTALARIIAMRTKSAFEPLNAVASGVKELRQLLDAARERQIHDARRTIIFIDEIHRFNRAQQDALLPAVENGLITLIGATTENPFFSVVAPLLSRSQIFEFNRLTDDHIVILLRRALDHPDRGFPDLEFKVDEDALRYFAAYAEGDARRAIDELMQVVSKKPEDAQLHLTLGELYRRTRQIPEAVTHLTEAARLAPNDAATHFQLGLACADAGDPPRAMAAFRRAVQLRPDDADAYYNLGVVAGESIKSLIDEKVAAYKKAAELRPTQADAHYQLGVAYIQKAQISRGDDKRALLHLALEQFRLFQQAAPQDPRAPTAAHNIQILEPQVK